MKRSEKSILLEINRELIRRGYLVTKLHGSAYQQAGLPDLLAIKDGKATWIEVKRPGGKTTKIQDHMLGKRGACASWRRAWRTWRICDERTRLDRPDD